jgi:hypothetical protein
MKNPVPIQDVWAASVERRAREHALDESAIGHRQRYVNVAL